MQFQNNIPCFIGNMDNIRNMNGNVVSEPVCPLGSYNPSCTQQNMQNMQTVRSENLNMNLNQSSTQQQFNGETNNGMNNGTTRSDNIAILINMITQMNRDFSQRLSSIESCLSKLGKIENEVTMVRADVANIKADNSSFSNRLVDVEIYCQNNSDSFDEFNKKTENNSSKITELKEENRYLNLQLSEMRSSYINLKEEFLELKTRTMQENLLFFGNPEPEQQRPNTVSNEENPIHRPEPENVEEQLRQFITSELRLEPPESVSNIKFDHVHRLGPIRTDRNVKVNPRPIIAKFERFSDRELVRKAGMEINSNLASKFKIREQFPKEIEDRRKMLYPAMYRLKNNPNNRVNLVRDKLYVNGRLYVPENDPEYKLPQPKSNF